MTKKWLRNTDLRFYHFQLSEARFLIVKVNSSLYGEVYVDIKDFYLIQLYVFTKNTLDK